MQGRENPLRNQLLKRHLHARALYQEEDLQNYQCPQSKDVEKKDLESLLIFSNLQASVNSNECLMGFFCPASTSQWLFLRVYFFCWNQWKHQEQYTCIWRYVARYGQRYHADKGIRLPECV
jgi:hypothetical protein